MDFVADYLGNVVLFCEEEQMIKTGFGVDLHGHKLRPDLTFFCFLPLISEKKNLKMFCWFMRSFAIQEFLPLKRHCLKRTKKVEQQSLCYT